VIALDEQPLAKVLAIELQEVEGEHGRRSIMRPASKASKSLTPFRVSHTTSPSSATDSTRKVSTERTMRG
jgi:hypothetical protein